MDTDYAWAAGFIDGEGCFYSEINKRGSVRVILSVAQRRVEPLLHLRDLFGAGTIDMKPPVKGTRASVWTVSRRDDLVRVTSAVRPYLVLKGDQADDAIALAQHLLEYGGYGSNGRSIDKDWCATVIARMRSAKKA